MISNIYVTPDFWVAIAFFIVVGSGYKLVVKEVGAMLDRRAETIRNKLDTARLLREEAQQLFAEYQRKQRDMIRDAESIISHACAESERHKTETLSELERVTQRRTAYALSRIAQAETQARDAVRDLAITIAIDATRRILAENMDRERGRALINQTIEELPLRLQGAAISIQ